MIAILMLVSAIGCADRPHADASSSGAGSDPSAEEGTRPLPGGRGPPSGGPGGGDDSGDVETPETCASRDWPTGPEGCEDACEAFCDDDCEDRCETTCAGDEPTGRDGACEESCEDRCEASCDATCEGCCEGG
ncbi:MAG: hypothetical protein ACOZNI_18620 [Myxococcota bacterium]